MLNKDTNPSRKNAIEKRSPNKESKFYLDVNIMIKYLHFIELNIQKSTSPLFLSLTIMTPLLFVSNVLSCDPYSSAFCAMRPTLETFPIVLNSGNENDKGN